MHAESLSLFEKCKWDLCLAERVKFLYFLIIAIRQSFESRSRAPRVRKI